MSLLRQHKARLIVEDDEGEELGVKATNCPAHCLMFATKKRCKGIESCPWMVMLGAHYG